MPKNNTKDAYYFSHDSNARNDPKLIKLRMDLGMEGYGIYFCLLEILREAKDHKVLLKKNENLLDTSVLAYDIRADEKKIQEVISDYDLFTVEDDCFYSKSLMERMLQRQKICLKRAKAGRKGGLSKKEPNGKQVLSRKGKERKGNKGKEIKGKEIKKEFVLPDWIPKEAWSNYLEMRKEIKKPMTSVAMKIAVTSLIELTGYPSNTEAGKIAEKILNKSTLSNWQGLFPLNENDRSKTNQGRTGHDSKKDYRKGSEKYLSKDDKP